MAHRPRPAVPAVRRAVAVAAVAVAGAAVAACGSSGPSSGSAAAGSSPGTGTSSGAAGAGHAAAVTIRAASVAGYGTVLVDGSGRSLYVLSTERGGTVTCTTTGDCTGIWPPVTLPAGTPSATAGHGITASALGTVTSLRTTRVTYHHWPLYTFAGDSAPGQANGEGAVSYGGTWTLLSPSGDPVPVRSPGPTPSSASSGSSTSTGGAY